MLLGGGWTPVPTGKCSDLSSGPRRPHEPPPYPALNMSGSSALTFSGKAFSQLHFGWFCESQLWNGNSISGSRAWSSVPRQWLRLGLAAHPWRGMQEWMEEDSLAKKKKKKCMWKRSGKVEIDFWLWSPSSGPQRWTPAELTLSTLSRRLLPDKRLRGPLPDKELPGRAGGAAAQLRGQGHPEAVAQAQDHQPDRPLGGRLSGAWPAARVGTAASSRPTWLRAPLVRSSSGKGIF